MSRAPSVLVSGAAGFIGSALVRRYLTLGWRVFAVDVREVAPEVRRRLFGSLQLDLATGPLEELIKAARPDLCLHAAGSASVPLSMTQPQRDFLANVSATSRLLEALRVGAPECRFVHLSSAAVYGDPARLPVDEAAAIRPLSPYGYHKLMAEEACRMHAELFRTKCAVARIFSAFGPGLTRQVVWDMIHQIETRGTLELQGLGSESRDFLFIDDLVAAIETIAARAPGRAEVYNVGSGVETPIVGLAKCVAEAAGRPLRPKFDGRAAEGKPNRWQADIGKLTSLGFAPRVGLEEGVKATVAWYRLVQSAEKSG